MNGIKKYADALERVVWTLVQVAGAGAVVEFYQHVLTDAFGWFVLSPSQQVIATGVLTVLISAGKNVAATNRGNGSSSLGLPPYLEPVPAFAVQHELAPGVGMPLSAGLDDPETDDAVVDADGDGHDDRNGHFV